MQAGAFGKGSFGFGSGGFSGSWVVVSLGGGYSRVGVSSWEFGVLKFGFRLWISEGCREAVGETLLIVQDMGQLLSSSLCVSKGIKSLWGCDRVRR